MIQKKFGYGMRDIFSLRHSLLRHSRCLPETLHCPKKAAVQPFIQVRLYYVTIVYDIIKFQIDLVILASSKNFDNRLHNLKCFISFFK